MQTIVLLSVVVLAAISTSGCATIVKGANNTVTVDTRPPGANCELTREGQTVAVINPTPGSIVVSKSRNDINVRCRKEGHEDSVGVLGSEFQAMTFGNILFGGIIGVAVDASSGAMNEYPPLITITMTPRSFRDAPARDEFYDGLRRDFIARYDQTVAQIRKNCAGGDEASCRRQLEAAETARAQKLAELEDKRSRATISG